MGVDNIYIKDGGGNSITLRAKDVSPTGNGTLLKSMGLTTPYPNDYGTGGFYQIASKSGAMAAGLASNAPIFSFRWPSSTLLAVVDRLRIAAWSTGTGFTAGLATFDLYRATAFSAADTGGTTDTITSPNMMLRTSMAASVLSEIRHSSTATLTAGTRTLDAQPVESLTLGVTTAQNTLFCPLTALLERAPGKHPLVLAQNEGFIVQATVPATGTWAFTIIPEWSEVAVF